MNGKTTPSSPPPPIFAPQKPVLQLGEKLWFRFFPFILVLLLVALALPIFVSFIN